MADAGRRLADRRLAGSPSTCARRCARRRPRRPGPTRTPTTRPPCCGLARAVLPTDAAADRRPADRRVRRPDRARRARQLARRQARPAHDAGRARRLPGLRAGRLRPGRPGQPPPGRLRPPPGPAGGRWTARLPTTRALAARAPTARALALDRQKLLVTSRALRLRREHPDWFAGATTRWPLAARGRPPPTTLSRSCAAATRSPSSPAAGRPAPARRLGRTPSWCCRAAVRPTAGLAGRPRRVAQAWRDVLTGAVHDGPRIPLARLLTRLPVASLVPAPQSG